MLSVVLRLVAWQIALSIDSAAKGAFRNKKSSYFSCIEGINAKSASETARVFDFWGTAGTEKKIVPLMLWASYLIRTFWVCRRLMGYSKGEKKLAHFECRRKSRNLEPKDAGELAFRIQSTSAKKGYFVTRLEKGLAEGAKMWLRP